MVAMDDFLCKSDLRSGLEIFARKLAQFGGDVQQRQQLWIRGLTVTTGVARSWVTASSSWSISLRLGSLRWVESA